MPPLSRAITGKGGNRWVTKPGRHIEISTFQEYSVQANGNTLAEPTSPVPSFLGVRVILSIVERFAFIDSQRIFHSRPHPVVEGDAANISMNENFR